MRVIAGALGGRLLRVPAGGTRPTSGLVRGALFAALQTIPAGGANRAPLEGWRVLDLYAGSGALGIEALSRGCAEAWFVEQAPQAMAVLRQNLAALALTDRAHTCACGVDQALRSRLSGPFELVLADPPYASGAAGVFQRLAGAGLVAPGGLVALEHATREELPERGGTLQRVWHRAYGGTALTVYAAAHTRVG